jgi:hypothetical protein
MLAQAEFEQSCHWYAYDIGVVPLHVPLLAVSMPPCTAVPETVGAAIFEGDATVPATYADTGLTLYSAPAA